MAEKNLMSAIAGLSDAKPDPDAKPKKKAKVVNLGHPHRNLGEYLHPKSTNKGK